MLQSCFADFRSFEALRLLSGLWMNMSSRAVDAEVTWRQRRKEL